MCVTIFKLDVAGRNNRRDADLIVGHDRRTPHPEDDVRHVEPATCDAGRHRAPGQLTPPDRVLADYNCQIRSALHAPITYVWGPLTGLFRAPMGALPVLGRITVASSLGERCPVFCLSLQARAYTVASWAQSSNEGRQQPHRADRRAGYSHLPSGFAVIRW